jgi:hypothetical protein
MTLGMRRLVAGIALVGAALVVGGYLTGAQWLQLMLAALGLGS